MADSKKKSILDKPLSSRGKNEISLSTYSFLFAELVSYSNNRSSSGQQLQEKLAELGHHVGHRMVDVLCMREKGGRYRETRLLNMLLYIKTTLWKSLFGKEADNLEQSTESEGTYYLIEDEPLVNKFISAKEGVNCAAFIGGVVEAFLKTTHFPAKVEVFWWKEKKTALRLAFDSSVLQREKDLGK